MANTERTGLSEKPSTDHALTLQRKLKRQRQRLSVFFADDNRMHPQIDAEAFGEVQHQITPVDEEFVVDYLWLWRHRNCISAI